MSNKDEKVKIVDEELEKISGGFKKIDIPSRTSIEKFKDEIMKIYDSTNKNK